MMRISTTLFVHYSTAQQAAYLLHQELSGINGCVLFCVATLQVLYFVYASVGFELALARYHSRTKGGIFWVRLARRIWRLRERSILGCCDERAWHGMTCVWHQMAWNVLRAIIWPRSAYRQAASTSLWQELSWAVWREVKVISTLRGSYVMCMRCLCAYLWWRELLGAAVVNVFLRGRKTESGGGSK